MNQHFFQSEAERHRHLRCEVAGIGNCLHGLRRRPADPLQVGCPQQLITGGGRRPIGWLQRKCCEGFEFVLFVQVQWSVLYPRIRLIPSGSGYHILEARCRTPGRSECEKPRKLEWPPHIVTQFLYRMMKLRCGCRVASGTT